MTNECSNVFRYPLRTKIIRGTPADLYPIPPIRPQPLPLPEIKVPRSLVLFDDLVHALSQEARLVGEVWTYGKMGFGKERGCGDAVVLGGEVVPTSGLNTEPAYLRFLQTHHRRKPRGGSMPKAVR